MKSHTIKTREQEIFARLRDRAASYFPALRAGFSIRLRGVIRRVFATLYEVEISNGRQQFSVFVKETLKPETVDRDGFSEFPATISPRFLPTPDPQGFERASLSAIDRHFSALSDPRFGTVRILDNCFDGWGFVMERVPHPPLSRLLPRTMRGSIRRLDLAPALRNAGAWLREFHVSKPPAHTQPAIDSSSGFLEDVACLQELLKAIGETHGPFQALLRKLPDWAANVLPSNLPIGLAHDDFAPRNVLAAPTHAVTVIDTLAERMAPTVEDLAHFLVHLKGHKLQMLGRGLPFPARKLAALEGEFLRGYFGDDEIPLRAIRLFEMKAVVARWAALRLNHLAGRRTRRLKQAVYRKWVRPFFLRMMRQLREDLEGSHSGNRLTDRRAELSSIVDRLIRRSGSYFDNSDAETTVIADTVVHNYRFSTIYSADIVAGKTSHRVIVKVPRNSDRDLATARVDDRPRLVPLMTPREEAKHEFAAMKHIHRHFSSHNTAEIRSVRPLDFCPRDGAVILEAVDAPTLHDLLQRDGESDEYAAIFSNSGRWLRALHDLPLPDDCRSRDETRRDYLGNVARYTAFLRTHGVDCRFLQTVEDSLTPLCDQFLPLQLPLGLSHGDFAPHNLFAFADGSVAAFDPLGHWQVP
ncbi:MAG: phosphotransferase, partial [Planctomycetes bacterium]|nr:phosphotransferase [Planctomycetota bacterium]